MDNNTTEFGSRITRSLRKRLTSVDDNTSRPGTPVPTKLTTISEISSPTTSTRMTRRVSSSGIATPVKTPAKRVVATSGSVVENLENITPARRSSRKRSTSVHENEENSQSRLQVPKFPTLDEEVVSNDTKKSTDTLQDIKLLDTFIQKKDKSPNKNECNENKMTMPMKRKPGPKCKTRGQKEYESDVEVSSLEEEIEDIKNNSSKNKIPLEDDESKKISGTSVEETNQVDSNKSTVKENDLELPSATNADEGENTSIVELGLKENITESPSFSCTEQHTLKDVSATNITITEIPLNENNQQEQSEELSASSEKEEVAKVEKQNLSIPYDRQETVIIEKGTTDIENKPECEEISLQENETILTVTEPVENNINLNENNYQTEETKETKEMKSPPNKFEIISVTTLISIDDGSPNVTDNKKLKFLSSPSNDMIMKTVYPKTPGSTKASNIIKKISSAQDDDNQNVLHNIENKNEETQTAKAEISPILPSEWSNASENLRNSTLANIMSKCEDPLPTIETNSSDIEENNDAKHLNTLEKSVDKEITEIDEAKSDNEVDTFPNQTIEEIKWINPSVKGTIENGSKLDVVTVQNNTNSSDCNENKDYIVKRIPKDKKKNIFYAKTEDKEDDDDSNELAPGEESYKKKHEFHDDVAIEVDSYESGNSMDSEERRELEVNEIPIDAESIGSHTTEDALDEYEEDEENNSFIVSDGEDLQFSESENEEDVKVDEQLGSDFPDDSNNDRSEDEKSESAVKINVSKLQGEKSGTESEDFDTKSKSCESMTDIINLSNKSKENIIFETSKLSDSALRLYCTAESGSEEEDIEENVSISRKMLLRNMNQSDRFNKSVRNLNQSRKMVQDDKTERKSFNEEHSTSTTPGESSNESRNGNKLQSESHLGEVSVTSESDGDKENEHKNAYIPKTDTGLSVSFDNGNKPKQRPELQRSFIIDVTVKDGELETTVADVKLKESISTSLSPIDDKDTDEAHEEEDTKHLENIKLMSLPLGNPLIRTRRQSLALPTNPDMAICSSSSAGKIGNKAIRKSLGVFSNIDFNPSQSFIDSINLQKGDRQKQVEKRKRLSKSFCGAPDTHDNSIIDIDVRHLHKKSKLTDELSMAKSNHGSVEDINARKIFTKISSTPYEKNTKENSYDKNQRILRRCDEILEAANRAKLRAKTNNKKTKISKKLSEKNSALTSLDRTNHDDLLRRVSKEIKRKDKTKSALSQAIKTGDSKHGIKKKSQQNKNERDMLEAKRLPADVLEIIGELDTIKKKTKKEKFENFPTSSTSAGKVVELPQSAEKKRKKTFIQLSTGKVSVEPITPKKRIVQTTSGLQFRESPVTPRAVGIKVRQIEPGENNVSSSSGLIEKKKKRNREGSPKDWKSLKSLWTQSGPFIEEEIPRNRQNAQHEIPHLKSESRKIKKGIRRDMEEQTIKRNFKESALMRPDIERSTKREILLVRERRQNHRGHYY